MARRTFACGHQGKGQYCHRCQQEAQAATRQAQEKAREREQREAWKDSFAADPIDLQPLQTRERIEKARELLRRLAAGELDLTFAVAAVEDGPWDFLPLADDPFVVISPADDPLAPPGEPVPAALIDGLAIIGQTPTACQALIEEGMRTVGAEPNVIFRTSDNSAVQAMVRSGMGHAVMARLAVDPSDPGISVHPVDPPMPDRTIGLVLPHRHRSPAVDVVVELARAVCAEVVADHVVPEAPGSRRRSTAA